MNPEALSTQVNGVHRSTDPKRFRACRPGKDNTHDTRRNPNADPWPRPTPGARPGAPDQPDPLDPPTIWENEAESCLLPRHSFWVCVVGVLVVVMPGGPVCLAGSKTGEFLRH